MMRDPEYRKRMAGIFFLATTAFGADGFEPTRPPVGGIVENLASSPAQEFAVVDNRPWKRPMGTTRWEPIENLFEAGSGIRFHSFGDTVVLVQGNKASVSLDNGGTWIPIGLPLGETVLVAYPGPGGLVCTEYVGAGTNHHHVHFSRDLGATWRPPILIPEEPVSSVVWKDAIYLALFDHGVLRVDPATGTSAPCQTGLPDSLHVELRTDGNSLLAHELVENRVYRYLESADRWETVLDRSQDGLRFPLRCNGGKAFLWSYDGTGVVLHHSADGGATWAGERLAGIGNLLDILPKGNGYLASTTDKGIFQMDGEFKVIGKQDEGLPPMIFHDLHVAGSQVYASGIGGGGNVRSTDLGKTWTFVGRSSNDGTPLWGSLVTLGDATYMWVGDSLKNISEPGLGMPSFRIVSRSFQSWFVDAGTMIYMKENVFSRSTGQVSSLYASVKGSGVWSDRMVFPSQIITSLAAEGEDVMATYGREAYVSRDAGRTWSVMPLDRVYSISKIVRFGGKWVASTNLGLYTADIDSKVWSPFAPFDVGSEIAGTFGSRMVVTGGSTGVKYTQDAGATWSTLALPFQPIGPLIFAMSDKVGCVARFDETGVRFAETWCTHMGSLPLSIRTSSWKRLEPPRSSMKFMGSRIIVGSGLPGATYTVDGGRVKP